MSEFNDQKAHYDSLISLFKYLITLTISLFTIIGGVITWLTYSSGKEMRDDLNQKKEELQKELRALKTDIKENEIQVRSNLAILTDRVNADIKGTRKDALDEIGNIKVTSRILAEQEARKKINDVFENKNFDDFVVKIAKERIEPKIHSIIDERIATINKIEIQNAVDNITSSEKTKVEIAWTYFYTNPSVELSDKQLNQIIKSYENKNAKEMSKIYMVHILQKNKSDISTKFFKKILYNEQYGMQNNSIAIAYFIENNAENEFLSKYLLSLIEHSSMPQDIYANAIFTSKLMNENYTIDLLNNRALVNELYNKLDKETLAQLRKKVEHDIINNININDFKNTYFFSL